MTGRKKGTKSKKHKPILTKAERQALHECYIKDPLILYPHHFSIQCVLMV